MNNGTILKAIAMVMVILAIQTVVVAEPKTLREAAGDRIIIGAGIRSMMLDIPEMEPVIGQQFNGITAAFEMLSLHTEKEKGQFTFEPADKIVDWALKHKMTVHGHSLIWHARTPKWLFEDEQGKPLAREVALDNLKHHITSVVKHFKGRVKGWQVINEAIMPGGTRKLRDTPAYRAIGEDYVLKAFEFAHAADPDAELSYNDYNIESGARHESTLQLVKQIRDAGLRIDAVGIQGHYGIDWPALDSIDKGIKAFIDAGFDVHITELDVDPLPRKTRNADVDAKEKEGQDPFKNGFPDEMQKKLADRYAELFKVFLKYPRVKRVTFWGVNDTYSWLNHHPVKGRTNHPLLWDRQSKPKPAFDAVLQTLSKHPE